MSDLKMAITAAVLGLAAAAKSSIGLTQSANRYYYPSEEAAELKAIVLPRLVHLSGDSARLQWPHEPPLTLSVGDRHRDLELVGTINQSVPMAVLERSFARWGVLVYIGPNGPVATMRKSIGGLERPAAR